MSEKYVWFKHLKWTENRQKQPDYNGREGGSKGDAPTITELNPGG